MRICMFLGAIWRNCAVTESIRSRWVPAFAGMTEGLIKPFLETYPAAPGRHCCR